MDKWFISKLTKEINNDVILKSLKTNVLPSQLYFEKFPKVIELTRISINAINRFYKIFCVLNLINIYKNYKRTKNLKSSLWQYFKKILRSIIFIVSYSTIFKIGPLYFNQMNTNTNHKYGYIICMFLSSISGNIESDRRIIQLGEFLVPQLLRSLHKIILYYSNFKINKNLSNFIFALLFSCNIYLYKTNRYFSNSQKKYISYIIGNI